MIETTNVCNLNCSFCANGGGSDNWRSKGSMSFIQFKKLINQVRGVVNEIRIVGLGEPFLTRDIDKIMDYIGINDLKLVIFTNGTVLNKKVINVIKKNYKTDITFSVNNIPKDNGKKNIKQAFKNMSTVIKLKRENNLDNLKLIWQFLIMRSNEEYIDRLNLTAKNIGIDVLRLKTLNISKESQQYRNLIPKNLKYRRKKNISSKKKCVFIDPGMPNVTWQGFVKPCCFSFFYDKYMGNVFSENILDIWEKDEYKNFRDSYLSNRNDICKQRCHFSKHTNIYAREIIFSK